MKCRVELPSFDHRFLLFLARIRKLLFYVFVLLFFFLGSRALILGKLRFSLLFG